MKKILTLIGLCILSCQAQAQSFLTNGLVAYYPFNGNANDASGNGYNATNFSVVLGPDRFGNASGAGQFNGSSSYILLPSALVNRMSGTGPMAVSSWVKSTITANNHAILNIGDASQGNDFAILSTGGLFYYSGWGAPNLLTGKQICDGVWHQCVASFDGTNMNLYVDGVFQIAQALTSNRLNTRGTIGVRVDLGNELWNGGLDDIRIYSRALSSNDIAQLYAYESPLSITSQPTGSTNLVGTTATFSVTAQSSQPLSYQWYFVPANNSGLAGAYAQIFNGFCVGAVITNGGFGYGNSPNVNFVGGGGSGASGYGTASNGVLTSITVTNAGSGYYNLPAVVIGSPNGYYYGQTNNTLTITNANPNSVGNYYVVVSNSFGSMTSSVVNLTLVFPPGIVQNPLGFTGSIDSGNTLSVIASGTPPLFYQWLLNGTNIAGATGSSYAITDLTLNTAGSYSVAVTNAYGHTNSSPVTVALLPSLISPFTGAIGIWGQNAVLNVGAVGSGALSYQWYFNGQAIGGATASSYALNDIQFTNAGLYNVVVSSVYGSVTNTAYQVVVNPANTSIGLFAGVTIQGTVGYSYNIQSTTNLSDPNSWVTMTNITLTSPIEIWDDNSSDIHNPGNPQKFYQVLPGQ
jgi:hypothetical protein